MKIGFIFPGQGSQCAGMGKDLYEKYNEIRILYNKVSQILGKDIAKLTFESSEEELSETRHTQIAILTMSLGILEMLDKYGIKADISAGLSLGEYTALMYSGSFNFEDGIRLVSKRGEIMQNNIPEGKWQMAGVLGVDNSTIEEICKNINSGFVVPANYNCPGQVVISGDEEAIAEASEKLKEAGARKVSILKTTGPFHTKKLQIAADKLRIELEKINIKTPNKKVIKNLDGKEYIEDNMVEILSNHIINPVRFSECIQNMINQGVDTFVEIGPGKVLTGLIKRISKDVKLININNVETLESAVQELVNNKKEEVTMEERKVALITGAARGIGKSILETFANEGYNVALNYRTKNSEVEDIKKEIEIKYGVKCALVQGDVSKFEDAERIVKETAQEFGKIDILVNNAGITRDGLLMRMSKEDFENVIDINLVGTFNVTRNVVPLMVKQRSGRIINISSVVGVAGNAGQTNYSASKAGIIGFTKSLAKEVASRNILVNAIAPGFIATDMTSVLSDKVKETINNQIPLNKMGTTEDVAKVVKFLASEDSSYITGQVINVDGGMIM